MTIFFKNLGKAVRPLPPRGYAYARMNSINKLRGATILR